MENNLILENGSTSGKWNFNGACKSFEYFQLLVFIKYCYIDHMNILVQLYRMLISWEDCGYNFWSVQVFVFV